MQKKIKNLRKKIRDINELEGKVANGQSITSEQKGKISKKQDVQSEIDVLEDNERVLVSTPPLVDFSVPKPDVPTQSPTDCRMASDLTLTDPEIVPEIIPEILTSSNNIVRVAETLSRLEIENSDNNREESSRLPSPPLVNTPSAPPVLECGTVWGRGNLVDASTTTIHAASSSSPGSAQVSKSEIGSLTIEQKKEAPAVESIQVAVQVSGNEEDMWETVPASSKSSKQNKRDVGTGNSIKSNSGKSRK